jgi:hypothetical protein
MTARRLAVVAGIDEYPHLRADQQLRGCVNDAELMAEVLMGTFGFREDAITLLRNAEASRDGILAALERLVADARPGDVVVVHFSGHGSQMTDREGDEADGLDETIVPADSGRGAWPNRDITDDEIYEVLTRLTAQTPLVTLIFDCCHSGSVTRDLAAARTRRIEPDLRPASQLPPSPVAAQLGQQGVGGQPGRPGRAGGCRRVAGTRCSQDAATRSSPSSMNHPEAHRRERSRGSSPEPWSPRGRARPTVRCSRPQPSASPAPTPASTRSWRVPRTVRCSACATCDRSDSSRSSAATVPP